MIKMIEDTTLKHANVKKIYDIAVTLLEKWLKTDEGLSGEDKELEYDKHFSLIDMKKF